MLMGVSLLFLPHLFILGKPVLNRKNPALMEIIEEEALVPSIPTNLNLWIESNIEDSIVFYTENITNDARISRAIVKNSLKNNIPVNLAFSLAYKESRFKIEAYNDNGKSRDRGLFQLNDSYRQNWSIEDFYNINKNSFEGTRYLKEMIELNEDDIKQALYCYNAGPTKVRKYGIIPERTKLYALEILKIESEYNNQLKKWIVNG